MKRLEIVAITRAKEFSPNSEMNDRAILEAAIENLSGEVGPVRWVSEEEVDWGAVGEDVIVHMCRRLGSLEQLRRLEDSGRVVVNSAYGIGNCGREEMTLVMGRSGIPQADTLILDTGIIEEREALREKLRIGGFEKVWIKKGDSYATAQEDVAYFEGFDDIVCGLRRLRERGVGRCVVSKHIEGDLVKFYGVAGSEWLHWFYPTERGHSKYGLERINGKPSHLPFAEGRLRGICDRMSEATGVAVYGGDCIVGRDGELRLIDFNDWPTFSPCLERGAREIAHYVLRSIREKYQENQK